jgi:hypothetical protein
VKFAWIQAEKAHYLSFKAHIPVDRREQETPPMLRVVEKPSEEHQELRRTLDEVLQRGALKMLHEALDAEVEEYLARHREARDAHGGRRS